jgi:hypothetical protein
VLDDVQRWRLLVDPARKNAAPTIVGPLHVELDEGAGQLLFFPRGSLLAGAQADDCVLPSHRLARPKGHVLDDSVALVENAEHGDALRHGGYSALPRRRRARLGTRGSRHVLLLLAAPACGERQRNQQRCGQSLHGYSGIHGS